MGKRKAMTESERIEAASLKAADAYVKQIRKDFKNGRYPGLCPDAATGQCRHTPKHTL